MKNHKTMRIQKGHNAKVSLKVFLKQYLLERVYLCRSSKETNTRIIFVVSVIEFKILKLVPALSIISSA